MSVRARRRWFAWMKNIFSCDLCVLRPTRAGCTLGNSKVGDAATLLPRGQPKPTEASDLDIYNDKDTDDDDKNDDDIDIVIDNGHENIANPGKSRPRMFHLT